MKDGMLLCQLLVHRSFCTSEPEARVRAAALEALQHILLEDHGEIDASTTRWVLEVLLEKFDREVTRETPDVVIRAVQAISTSIER